MHTLPTVPPLHINSNKRDIVKSSGPCCTAYSPPINTSDSDSILSASFEYGDIQETTVYQEGAHVPTTESERNFGGT